ncbi:hypothetical protein Mal15_21450 [Stieleria maiorica]|uniref:Uncharacterized protein n=1 Tax=Stieleria maiorica TaxID=2795974 RepID=A0A5B9MAE6_9BACT|nr:hypothetical protein Mal15_21450 [Stieleria maiorica]
MYSIRIAVGKFQHPDLQPARQASVVSMEVDRCRFVFRQVSRPRTRQTVTSRAIPRKRRFDDTKWAKFKRTRQQHGRQAPDHHSHVYRHERQRLPRMRTSTIEIASA